MSGQYRVDIDYGSCNCGQIHGYRVVGPRMRAHKLLERLAAEKGAELVNAGKITAKELGVLWGVADTDIALSAAKMQLEEYMNRMH